MGKGRIVAVGGMGMGVSKDRMVGLWELVKVGWWQWVG